MESMAIAMLKTSSDRALQGVALWRRIADDMEQEIAAGIYAAGDRLPSEMEMAQRFDVNRHTVRRALAELAQRGLVRAERGSGIFVEPRRIAYPIGARTRFSEIVGSVGREVGGRLMADSEERAPDVIAQRLRVAAGAPVVRLEILRSADGLPICAGTTWLPAGRLPGIAQIFRAKRGMTAALAHFGIHDYRRHSTRISTTSADALDAQRLRTVAGRPLLLVDSVDVLPTGEPLMTTRSRFAPDRVELVVEG
jgi:GntR family transcriptional regulator, phosphonate transport system regulatory protein